MKKLWDVFAGVLALNFLVVIAVVAGLRSTGHLNKERVDQIKLVGDNGVSGYVVSPDFEGVARLDRDTQIERALRDPSLKLTRREQRRVLVIAPWTPDEFEMFDRDITKRLAIQNEVMATLKSAWTGEPSEFRGRTVRVTPKPAW